MPYNNNIPLGDDILSESQGEMRENFANIKTLVDINHGTFGAADEGQHKWVSYVSGYNIIQPTATEYVTKSFQSNFTNTIELALKRDGLAGFAPFTVKQNPMPNDFGPGWATLGGTNLIMKWGRGNATGFGVVGFPEGDGIPNFSAPPYHISLTVSAPGAFSNNRCIRLVTATDITMSVYASARTPANTPFNVIFNYFAIGPT